MNCPRCTQPLPALAIDGARYRAVKKTHIPKRYIDVGDDEVLFVRSIPMLLIAPKKEGEHEAPKIPAGHPEMPELQEDIQADRRSKVSVLQEKSWQPTSPLRLKNRERGQS